MTIQFENRQARGIYNAVWRWHFYLGLFSVPFLLLMSSTGAIYLFNEEIEAWTLGYLLYVAPRETPRRTPTEIISG